MAPSFKGFTQLGSFVTIIKYINNFFLLPPGSGDITGSPSWYGARHSPMADLMPAPGVPQNEIALEAGFSKVRRQAAPARGCHGSHGAARG